jgi:hypothetical protein
LFRAKLSFEREAASIAICVLPTRKSHVSVHSVVTLLPALASLRPGTLDPRFALYRTFVYGVLFLSLLGSFERAIWSFDQFASEQWAGGRSLFRASLALILILSRTFLQSCPANWHCGC